MKYRLVFSLLLTLLIVSPALHAARADPPAVCTDRLISLDLQDTEMANAFRIMSEVCKQNIVLDPEVKGKITIRLIDVPAEQVLRILLRHAGLAMELIGSGGPNRGKVLVKKKR